jgi:hypothetical protein
VPADPRDRFDVYAGSEHMFFGFDDPFAFLREQVEHALRGQVADTAVDSIVAEGKPKFLTFGRKVDDGSQVIVTWFATCVRATISASAGGGTEVLPAAITMMFGRVDETERLPLARFYLDLHDDAEREFDDERFQARFMAFRHGDRGPDPA